MLIPVFTRQRPAAPSISLPRLYPFYYQTNADAPEDLYTAVDFPWHYRQSWYRVNRPLMPGMVALARTAVMPAARLAIPPHKRGIRWGAHTAADIVVTYAAWIMINALCTFLAAWMLMRVFGSLLGPPTGLAAGVMILTSPVVILGIREISHGALELLLIAASIAFWHRVLTRKMSTPRLIALSLGIGVLFLGKLAVSTFAAGVFICLASRRRHVLAIILPCVALPTLAWIGVTRLMGIPYVFSDVSNYGPTLHRVIASSWWREMMARARFGGAWLAALAESVQAAHLPFVLIGAAALWKSGRLLTVAWVFALSDAVFYAILLRAHAVYALHTAVMILALAAFGIASSAAWATTRFGWSARAETGIFALAVIICQLSVNLLILPRYAG